MNFRINVESLLKAVKPAADIALKNVEKNDRRELFHYAGMLTIEASRDALHIRAYGGTASIIVKVNKADGYTPKNKGAITVHASEVMDSLKSFLPTDNLVVSAQRKHMKLALESDEETFIELSAPADIIECPPMSNKIEQESVVDRACFVKGMQNVAYAMAFEEKYHTYMCILFESWKNRMRFIAGTGGRFAVIDIASDGKPISSGRTKVIFPKTNVSNIIRIFKDACQPTIKVTSAGADPKKRIVDQVIIENDKIALVLYGLEFFTRYPDINPLLNHDYSYRITTRMRDWRRAAEAIRATFHFHKDDIHNTRVTADLLHGYFSIRPISEMQISKKVDFELGAFVTYPQKGENGKPWFRCNSEYLFEMVKQGHRENTVTLNFEDQAILDDMSDGKPKQMKPVVLTYPERTNRDGIREKRSAFFTVSSI